MHRPPVAPFAVLVPLLAGLAVGLPAAPGLAQKPAPGGTPDSGFAPLPSPGSPPGQFQGGKPAPLPPSGGPQAAPRPGPPTQPFAPPPGQAQGGKPAPLPSPGGSAPPAGRPPGGAPGPQARPPGAPQPSLAGKPPPLRPGEEPPRQVSSGTGFVVAENRALTNHHVIRDCRAVRARTTGGRELEAVVRASDERRDLAILELRGPDGAAAGLPALSFRRGPQVRRGEAVVTYGFPLAGVLSSGPTLTTGDISALAGLADNNSQFQISAPVQPGNSGGPLLDGSGLVVGVIVSKLNAQRIAQRTGDIPQNVNFAVKGSEALAFLQQNQVEPRQEDSASSRTPAEIGETADPSVLFLRCLR